MVRSPLNLALPLHAEVFQKRQELEVLRGCCADLVHALQHNDLQDRAALQALYEDIRTDARQLLEILKELELQLDVSYQMTHEEIV